jgi:hypothetical protein
MPGLLRNLPKWTAPLEVEEEEEAPKKTSKKSSKKTFEENIAGDTLSSWARAKQSETAEERSKRLQREFQENLKHFEERGFGEAKKGSNRVQDVVKLFGHGTSNPKAQKTIQKAAKTVFQGRTTSTVASKGSSLFGRNNPFRHG